MRLLCCIVLDCFSRPNIYITTNEACTRTLSKVSHGVMIVTHFSLFVCLVVSHGRPLWSRLNALRLFVQHISFPCKDQFLNHAAYRFFNVSVFDDSFLFVFPYRARNEPALPRSIYLCADLLSPLL